jgi:hypothetical protein
MIRHPSTRTIRVESDETLDPEEVALQQWEEAFSCVGARALLILHLRANCNYSLRDVSEHLEVPYQTVANIHHEMAAAVRDVFGERTPTNRRRPPRGRAAGPAPATPRQRIASEAKESYDLPPLSVVKDAIQGSGITEQLPERFEDSGQALCCNTSPDYVL